MGEHLQRLPFVLKENIRTNVCNDGGFQYAKEQADLVVE